MRSTKAKCPHGPEGTIFRRVQGGPACRKLNVKKFSDLLSKEQIRDLGPVSETWFEDLTAEALSKDNNAAQATLQDDLETPMKSHHHGNGQTSIAATPVPDGKVPITPSSCSPSLFSPNIPDCNGTDRRSRFRLENNMGQSTPVLPQSQKKFLGFSGLSQLPAEEHHTLGYIQPSVGLSPGVGGSPLPILPETESSVLSRRLFKTPQGPSSQGFFSEPIASRFLPTPERLTVTLGGDLNCSALSWTSSMATPGTAAVATPTAAKTPTAAMATPEAADLEDFCDPEGDVSIAADGKKLARALFIQCEGEMDADPDLKPTQDKSEPEENLRDVFSTQHFQSQTDGTLTQEFESTLTHTTTAQETNANETVGRRKHQNSDLNDTQESKDQAKVSNQSHASSSQNTVQDDVDKTLDFLFAKSERRSQKKELPPPKRRKWNKPTSETQSGAVPLVGETGLDEGDSKDGNCKPGTVTCQQDRNASCTTRIQCERSLNHAEETTESQKITKPSSFVENTKGGQAAASPVSVVNMDFFSQISPSSLQEICEAADAAAAKSVDSRNESSRDRCKKEHQVQSGASKYKLEDEGVSNTKESGLGKEDNHDTKSVCAPYSDVNDGKNSDLQSDAISLSESPSPTNPTQGTLDVMNISSQVLKQQTHAKEGHLAADIGTARVEDKTALGYVGTSRQQNQTATPSLVFNLKVPAKKVSLQDTPKFSATTSASTANRGGSARRFFYPTSSQISRSTPKTLFPSHLHGNEREFKGEVKRAVPTAIPSSRSVFSPCLGQGGKQNPPTIRDVAKGTSSRTFRLSECSTSFRQQGTREHSKKDFELNTEQPNNESASRKNDVHKSDMFSTAHNQTTSNVKMPNSKLPQLASITNRIECINNRTEDSTTCSNEVVTCPVSSYGGFQTASRKEIRISETAMKKAAALAAEVDAEMAKTSTNMFSNSTRVGTASKKDNTEVTKPAIQTETRRTSEVYTFSEARKDKCLESGREFVGFSTASNKRIEISDKALKQAKALVNEVDDSLLAEMTEQTDSIGDPTLKDSRLPLNTSRLINVPTNALETAKAFSGDVDKVDQDAPNRQLQRESGPMSNTSLVAISSTKKPSSCYDIQKSCSNEASCYSLSVGILKGGTKHTFREFTGFQTASNKPIQVSLDAMKRAKTIVKEVESSMAGQAQWEKDRDHNPFLNANGLETTSTKGSTVSSDDVSNTKAVTAKLKDFVGTRTRKNQETSHRASLHTTGFKTASKKPIQISADAMRKARSLAAEVDAGLASGSNKHEGSDQTAKVDVTDFTTASKKPIRVAASSMERAKALTAEVEAILPPSACNSFTSDQKYAADCPGFKTASDKNILVSTQSLQKARLLLAEVDEGKADQLSSTEDGSARKCTRTTVSAKPSLENGTFQQPRGHLPFKPPSKVLGSGKHSALSGSCGKLKSVRATANTNSVHLTSTAAGATCKLSQPMGEENSLNDSFHDDQLFCTQMVSAAEVAESTYAFLQAEKEDGGSDDDFGFSGHQENKDKTPDASTSLSNSAEKVNFDKKTTKSQTSPSKDKQHEIVRTLETESSHTKIVNAAISKRIEVTAVVRQCSPKSSDQNAVAQENGTAKPTDVQKTSSETIRGHTVANKKLQTMQRKIVTICDAVKEADTALLDESFDLAWGLVDEMVVKAMEASIKKLEENNTSPNPEQNRQADTHYDHRHSLDSGLGESRIISQENNVSMTSSSSLEEPRHHITFTSGAGRQSTDDVSVSVKEHTQCKDMSYKSCPFTTASGRKVSVTEGALKHVKELAKEELLPPEEISVPLNKLSRCPSPKQVSHMSLMERLRETSSEDNQLKENEQRDSSNNVGFSTAGGKKIHVSKKSLEKAGQLWDSTELPEQEGKASLSGEIDRLPTFQGFQTASGHKVNISDAALSRAKQMWNESREPEQDMLAVSADKSFSKSGGFKTASGKRVRISDKALQKAQQMWKESGEPQDTLTSKVKACSSGFPGFQTASGHKVAVSEEALQKAQQLWKDTDRGEADMQVDVSKKPCKTFPGLQTEKVNACSSGFPGFQTASGHKVAVSEEALQKAQQLWKDTDREETELEVDVNKKPCKTFPGLQTEKVNACSSGFPGFQTASGHKVAVSEEALQKAQRLWNETDRGGTELEVDVSKKPCKTFSGLQTARGCKVVVSEESMRRVKQMWSDEDENCDSQQDISTTSVKHEGFTTAAGKHVRLLERALLKVEQPCAETDKSSSRDKESSSGFHGFQTASGKRVDVSDHALSRARELWIDTEDDFVDTDATKEDSLKCTGFQTARGKKVHVSVEALQKAKLVWKNDEVEETCPGSSVETQNSATFNEQIVKKKDISQCPKNASFAGFKTASGRTVNVSEASLQRAKHMFQDVEEANMNRSVSNKEPMGNSEPSEFQGFTTGRGRKVEVSKKSLQVAKDMWKESESGFKHPAESAKESTEDREKSTVTYEGFQTAGGQKIHVSKEALQKAKALFSDDAPPSGSYAPQKSSLTDQEQVNNGTGFKGFQTAKGKKIVVSEEALQKARAVLSDDFKESQERIHVPKMKSMKDKNSLMFRGFQTGRGRQIEVSEEALQKARARLSEEKSMELDTGFAESTAEHSPVLQRSVPSVLSSGIDKYRHGTEIGVPQDKEEQLYKDRSARKRTLTSSETKAIWPPSKRQSPSPAQLLGHRQAFRPPVATHPEGVVHDRHGFSVRTRLQPLHSKPRQDFRRPPSLSPATRQPVVSTPQAHNSTENSFKTPFKSPGPTFSAPFKAKPGKEDGKTECHSPACATTGNTPDSLEPCQEACKDDNSVCDKHKIVTEHPEKVQALERTRKAQAVRIAQKKKQVIHPEYGSLLQKRLTQRRVGLREAVCSQTPGSYTTQELYSYGVHQSTCTVTSETAESFRFVCRDHVSPDTLDRGEGVTLTEGGVSVPLEDDTAGKEEFVSALLDTPGVDPGLVTPEWIHNHYRWIVWKLAAMEAAFPVQFGGRCLTPDQVLMQLKYRYDREVDFSQRSALKKILERDDTPSKTLVLCVARITPHTGSQDCTTEQDSKKVPNTKQKETIIELTDGWYGVKAALDPPLARLVESKRIYVGQKLCVSGAELVGSQDACSPLEAPANLLLKLSANATRRARWDAKLGFHSNPQPFPVSLCSLCADGGMVGCVDVLVLRSYPMQYMEKYPSGSSVFRSRRAEEKAARKHEEDRNRRMEKLYSQIQDKFERRTAGKGSSVGRRRKSLQLRTEDIENLQTGQEIYEALQGAMDPTEIEQCLSPAQRSRLYDHQRSLQAEQQGELQAEFRKALQQLDDEIPVQRNVVAMYRVRLADYQQKEARNAAELPLTVWRPTDHVMDMLKEGKRLKIFHLSTSAARNQVQLASTRTTRYQDLPVKPDTLEEVYTPRKLATFEELCASDFRPACGEVDVVGVVVYITGQSGNSSGVQTVFLADTDQNLCSVKFWGGVSAHGLEDVLKLRALVGGVNLQWRPDDRLRVPCLTFGDQADFSQKPQHSHLRDGLTRLEESVKDVKSFTESMVQEVERVVYSRQAFSPGPANTSRARASPNPGNRTGPQTPASRIFTPARAHSTPNNSVSTPRLLHCKSPAATSQVTPYGGKDSHIGSVQSSGKGKPGAQSRRSLLDRVPSPPPLTTLVSPIPHRVKRAFKRPGLVPLNNGRGSPAFVPPVKKTVEGYDVEKAASGVDLGGSGDVTEISDAEMASICTQNTPDKREGSVANGIDQESTVHAQARLDGEQREDFISDTQLLTAFTNENEPGLDTQPNEESLAQKIKVTPKQSKPFQRRGSRFQRRGRRGANGQGTRATAVQSTDVETPGLQTIEDCTTPEEERLAIPEGKESSVPPAINTVVIEDGIEKETEAAGSSQDSVDSQNVATRTRSSLRLAKKRKR